MDDVTPDKHLPQHCQIEAAKIDIGLHQWGYFYTHPNLFIAKTSSSIITKNIVFYIIIWYVYKNGDRLSALDWNINRGTVGYTGGRDWKPADAPGDTQVMIPQNVN